MSFFIATFPKSGVSQEDPAKLIRIGSCRHRFNLSHLSMRKKPTIWRALMYVNLGGGINLKTTRN